MEYNICLKLYSTIDQAGFLKQTSSRGLPSTIQILWCYIGEGGFHHYHQNNLSEDQKCFEQLRKEVKDRDTASSTDNSSSSLSMERCSLYFLNSWPHCFSGMMVRPHHLCGVDFFPALFFRKNLSTLLA